jgi:hypothetical protein
MIISLKRLPGAWQQFWFEPQETSTLALFRIAFGLVALAWTASQAPNLMAFYGPHGVLPHATSGGPGSWGVLNYWHGSAAVVALLVVTLVSALALTVGFCSRLAAILVLVGIISFEQRNLLVTNSGDGLVRNLAFFCALAPSGESLSMDRLLRKPQNFWEFPKRAPWALRLIQLQISIGYFSAVWHKAGNDLWRNGTAVAYSLRIDDIHRFATPGFITHSVVLTELLTYGTLASELALGVLLWNATARPWVIIIGLVLHLSIDYWILVGFFSYAMFCGYVAFTKPENATRWTLWVRDRARLAQAFLGRNAKRPVAGAEPVRHLEQPQSEHGRSGV